MDTAPHGHSGAAAFHPRGTGSAPGARTCHRHADRESRSHCITCMAGLCTACVVLEPEGAFCASCRASRRAERRGQLMFVAWMGGLAALGLVILVVNARPSAGVGERAEARARVVQQREDGRHLVDGVDYGAEGYAAAATWKRLQRNRCDEGAALGLASIQRRTGHLDLARGTLDAFERCADTGEVALERARLLRAEGNLAEASSTLLDHLSTHVACVDAQKDRWEVAMQAGNTRDAQDAARAWSALLPGSHAAMAAVVDAARASGDACTLRHALVQRDLAQLRPGRRLVPTPLPQGAPACAVTDARFGWFTGSPARFVLGRGKGAVNAMLVPHLPRTLVSRALVSRMRLLPGQPTVYVAPDDDSDAVEFSTVHVKLPGLGTPGTEPWWAAHAVDALVAAAGEDEHPDLGDVDVLLGRDVLSRLAWVDPGEFDARVDSRAPTSSSAR